MSEPSLIDITNDKEFMERVLKKSEEMQEEILKKAEGEEMSIFTIQELKDLYQALNMSIDWHSELDAPNKLKRLHELQDKIDKMIKEKE